MLVGTDIMNRIDDIVDHAYLDFTFRLIGDDFLTDEQRTQIEGLGLIVGRRPLIELLYMLVRQRSTPGYRKDVNLQRLLDEIAETGVLPLVNDTHQYSIEHGKAQINEAIETTKNEIKKKVSQEILTINNDYKNEMAVGGIASLEDIQKRSVGALNKLLVGVGAAVLASQTGFIRAFTTTLTDFANNATVDSATSDMTLAESPEEIKCYKSVITDSRLCQWCHTFYTDVDGKPKIYKLKDLQANGSNDGKPKSAWRPVVGSTHPRCRCQLHYLKE